MVGIAGPIDGKRIHACTGRLDDDFVECVAKEVFLDPLARFVGNLVDSNDIMHPHGPKDLMKLLLVPCQAMSNSWIELDGISVASKFSACDVVVKEAVVIQQGNASRRPRHSLQPWQRLLS